MKAIVLLALLAGCATGAVGRVEFSSEVDQTKRQLLPCALIPDKRRLVCVTPEQAELIAPREGSKGSL